MLELVAPVAAFAGKTFIVVVGLAAVFVLTYTLGEWITRSWTKKETDQ